jgi:hypothetical protein
MTLTLLGDYIDGRDVADVISDAASYGPDAQRDLIQLIARYQTLTGDVADTALMALDLDGLLAAIDIDD